MELQTLMRLRGAIGASLDSVPSAQAAAGGQAMTEAYGRCRAEVRSAIASDDALSAEFDRVFPPAPTSRVSVGLSGAARFHEQHTNLARMQGWLDGQIEFLKFERQAKHDAAAKAKPGIGFNIRKVQSPDR